MRRQLIAPLLAASLAAGASDALRVSGEWLLTTYKRVLSPLQGSNVCNYTPSCSQYARGAIAEAGFFPGIVMSADRLMRCSIFAWSYADECYAGVENNRVLDPPSRHLAWRPVALTTSGALLAIPADDRAIGSGRDDTRLASRLYAAGALDEAAMEFLRLRFTAPHPALRAYGGLMAGEAYLSGRRHEDARRAFRTSVAAGTPDHAHYGAARAWFAQGRFAETRAALESLATGTLAANARVLSAWSFFRQGDFDHGARLMSSDGDALGARLSRMNGADLARRSRLLSSLLSAVIPGAGQLYSGRAGDGIYSFLTVGTLGAVTAWFLTNPGRDPGRIKAGIFGSLAALFHAGNIYGANIAARDFNDARRRRYIEEADELFVTYDLVPDYTFLLDACTGPGDSLRSGD